MKTPLSTAAVQQVLLFEHNSTAGAAAAVVAVARVLEATAVMSPVCVHLVFVQGV